MKYQKSSLSKKKALLLTIALAIMLAVTACSGASGEDDGVLNDRPEPGHEEPAAGIGSGNAAGGGDQTGSAPSEEAIVWRDPKLEALVREKIAKPTGNIYQSDLQYFWGIEVIGESHVFFNASGGYGMVKNPDDFTNPGYSPETVNNPDKIEFRNDYGADAALAKDGIYSVRGRPYIRGGISSLADFANFPNLSHLHVYKNEIKDLSGLSELDQLLSLHLVDCAIEDISALSGLKQVRSIVLTGNKVEDISPLANLSQVWRLTLINNQIREVDALSSLENLVVLHLLNEPVSNVDAIMGLNQLRNLHISYTKVSDLSFLYSLYNLGSLSVDNLDAESVDLTPISHHRNLVFLRTSQYKARLLNLEALYGLELLETLYIRPNVNLSEDDLAKLKGHLPYLVFGDIDENYS